MSARFSVTTKSSVFRLRLLNRLFLLRSTEQIYLGVGAVFKTGSKDDADDVSHDELQKICEAVDIPVIAIGGISSKNVTELKGRGIVGIAVISAIFAQPDITKATAELKALTEKTVAND